MQVNTDLCNCLSVCLLKSHNQMIGISLRIRILRGADSDSNFLASSTVDLRPEIKVLLVGQNN